MADKSTKGKWTIELSCGFPYTGIYIVSRPPKDFPFWIAQIRQLREREESEANARRIVLDHETGETGRRLAGMILDLDDACGAELQDETSINWAEITDLAKEICEKELKPVF